MRTMQEDKEQYQKQSLHDWQIAARLTAEAFARELKIGGRLLRAAMEQKPIHEVKAYLIVDGIRRYFEHSVEPDKLPNSPEDIEGLVIYDPAIHRRSTAKK